MFCIFYMPKTRQKVAVKRHWWCWMSGHVIEKLFFKQHRHQFCRILRPCQVHRSVSSTRVQVNQFSTLTCKCGGLKPPGECGYQNHNFTHLCTHRSVLVSKYIPEGQAQPSTQSLLHVSGTDSAWQVLPQVDTQVLYSFVSPHERAVQTKQISQITVQETQGPPNSFLINIAILLFPITLNSTKIAILALCCVNYTDVNPQ